MKWLYLGINVFTVLIPLVFSFHPKIRFHLFFRETLGAISISAVIFIAWDMLFTSMGVWGFNPDYLTGIYVFHLPIEEILFFITVPYACLFTYYCMNTFFHMHWTHSAEQVFVLVTAAALMITGLLYYDRLYTSVSFISLSLLLLVLKYIMRVTWLAGFVLIYPLVLIGFFLVNGILTGMLTPEPVVFYNDNENMGIRLWTIPVEDVFYGFELILLNVFWFEYAKRLKGTWHNLSLWVKASGAGRSE